MPIAQLKAYECIASISRTLLSLNQNLERIASALEKQNQLAELHFSSGSDEPVPPLDFQT